MPRSKSRPKNITIGIFGLGETPPQNITALLDDHLGDAEATFILPATPEHFTKTIDAIATYCSDTDTEYEVITNDSSAKARSLKLLISEASATTKASNVGTAIVNRLREAEDGRLIVLWDDTLGEEDGGAYDAIEYADENSIPVFDLCNGLEPIDLGDPEEIKEEEKAPEPEPEAEEEEEKPRSRRGRGKLAAVKDDDGPGEDDEPAPVSDPTLPPYEDARELGIRVLRNMARERELAGHRAIGSMDKDGVLALLYPNAGVAKISVAAVPEPHQTTLEEQIAAAEHAVTAGARTPLTNGKGAMTIEVLIEALAVSVAERVKELVDA